MAGNVNWKIEQGRITRGVSLVKWTSVSLQKKEEDSHHKSNGQNVSSEWDKLFLLQRIEYSKPKQRSKLNRMPQSGYRSDWENHYLQNQKIQILPCNVPQ